MPDLSVNMKRGQIFTWDLIFGVTIFLITLIVVIYLWEVSYNELRYVEQEYEMNWLVETVSDQLVRTSGEPQDWIPQDVIAYGLAESKQVKRELGEGYDIKVSRSPVESRILDADKILFLIQAFSEDYARVRNSMLGSSKFDIYLELRCVNEPGLACLQGLKLDKVNYPVYCNNKRINVNNYRTDSYLWFEAEHLFGQNDDIYCSKGCSNNNMSRINDAGESSIKVDEGTYHVWVRAYQDNSDAKIVLNGMQHNIFETSRPETLGWNWVGEQMLEGEVTVGFDDTIPGNRVDAILLTTDVAYNPNFQNIETYGDPNTEDTCIIGYMSKGRDIVSSRKNGLIGEPLSKTETFSGTSRVLDRMIELKVVLWGGQPSSSRNGGKGGIGTTTTTLPPQDLVCSGSPSKYCVPNHPPAIDIIDFKLWDLGVETDTIECGRDYEATLTWMGSHLGDPNYFGFFINDATNYIDSCMSTQNDPYSLDNVYEMNCTLEVPDKLQAADGEHDLIVTAEDEQGYCDAEDTRADDQRSFKFNVADCVEYTDLDCVQVYGMKEGTTIGKFFQFDLDGQGVEGELDTVKDIYSVETGGLRCGNWDNRVTVYWGGRHGDDDAVFWGFLMQQLSESEYHCIATCNSTRDDDGLNMYRMSCDLNISERDCKNNPHNIPDSDVNLYVTAESYNLQYCSDPMNCEAVEMVTVPFTCPAGGYYAVLGYYIADNQGVTNARFYSNLSGEFRETPINPKASHDVGVNEIYLENVPQGKYHWNIYLEGSGWDNFLYQINRCFKVPGGTCT